MSLWTLLQVGIDLFAVLGLFMIFMRLSRQPKDDPRLSRGLQLLQSKIAVLEDLSDRTENQVNQLTAILDQKSKEVQAKVQLAEQHVHEIRVSMERSLDVAKIFQDKIPHQEIIERQNTIKYVQAARLAHQGLGAEEIAAQVDLPKGEIDFIAKVNREQLMFNEDGLPWWAKQEGEVAGEDFDPSNLHHLQFKEGPETVADPSVESPVAKVDEAGAFASRAKAEMEMAEQQRLVESLSRLQFEMKSLDQQLARESSSRDLSDAFVTVKFDGTSLNRVGEEFKKVCDEAEHASTSHVPNQGLGRLLPSLEQISDLIPQLFQGGLIPEQVAPAPAATPAAGASASAASMAVQTPGASQEVLASVKETAAQDPEALRQRAQEKVQNAMNLARVMQTQTQGSTPDALVRARALAKNAAVSGQGKIDQVASTARYAKSEPLPKAAPGEVRKVQFPRIDSVK